jgi:two-component system cell cycle response regulator DivK
MTTPFVLVVDDNAINAKLLRLVLESEAYEVETAIDAESALDVLATRTPCLILMDVQLPGIDGLELTRRLKADPTLASVPIVAVSANAMKGDADRARAAGCDDYITKPIELEAFVQTVTRYAPR